MLLTLGTFAYGKEQPSSKPIDQSNNASQLDFRPYLQTGSSAAQVASAVAFLDACAVPLTFEEEREERSWVLNVICSEEENSAGVRLEFRAHPTSGAFPFLEPLSFTAFP